MFRPQDYRWYRFHNRQNDALVIGKQLYTGDGYGRTTLQGTGDSAINWQVVWKSDLTKFQLRQGSESGNMKSYQYLSWGDKGDQLSLTMDDNLISSDSCFFTVVETSDVSPWKSYSAYGDYWLKICRPETSAVVGVSSGDVKSGATVVRWDDVGHDDQNWRMELVG